jgi:hypothetical protein
MIYQHSVWLEALSDMMLPNGCWFSKHTVAIGFDCEQLL